MTKHPPPPKLAFPDKDLPDKNPTQLRGVSLPYYHVIITGICPLVGHDRVRRLATDPVVMRSSPATGH